MGKYNGFNKQVSHKNNSIFLDHIRSSIRFENGMHGLPRVSSVEEAALIVETF